MPGCACLAAIGEHPSSCIRLTVIRGFDLDPGAGVQNNGDVTQITNNLNNDRPLSFTCDELNRLQTMSGGVDSSTAAALLAERQPAGLTRDRFSPNIRLEVEVCPAKTPDKETSSN